MMSNTGGGHRASAEAIRDAFQEKHGDKYKVGRTACRAHMHCWVLACMGAQLHGCKKCGSTSQGMHMQYLGS